MVTDAMVEAAYRIAVLDEDDAGLMLPLVRKMLEATERVKPMPPLSLLKAGNAFRDSLIPRADAHTRHAPLWHGWAIMDAFIAGAEYGQESADRAAWQPIETAPRDGTVILVYRHIDGLYGGVDKDEWKNGSWWRSSCENQPTHWRPLPRAPTTEKAK